MSSHLFCRSASCCHVATFIYYITISNEEPRLYTTENLEASGTAGKLRLSKLYCSERREPSGRFSWDIDEANRIRRSRCGNNEGFACLLLPRRYLSNVRNVAITRRPRSHPFHYLCGYTYPTYSIVCGNCEVISFSSATTWSNFSRNANCCFNSFSNSSSCAVFIRAYSVLLHASAFIVDSK